MRSPMLAPSVLLFAVGCGTAPPECGDPPPGDGGIGDAGGWSDAGVDAGAAMPSPNELAIATWNVEQFPRHTGTIDAVAELVEEHRLDLIGVQEITDPDAFEQLADALPDHDMFVSFDSRAYTRVGFLYRRDRIVVGEVDRLFRRDWWAFPRDPLMAEIDVIDEHGETLFDFTFVVLHLKAQVDDESRARRAEAIVMLDEWIRERVATDPDVVVVGDFNDELTDAPGDNVYGPLLDAPDRYAFLTLDEERAGAHSYIVFRAMIDHILVTTDALSEYGGGRTEVLEIDRHMRDYRRVVSDHLPVVSRFALPAVP